MLTHEIRNTCKGIRGSGKGHEKRMGNMGSAKGYGEDSPQCSGRGKEGEEARREQQSKIYFLDAQTHNTMATSQLMATALWLVVAWSFGCGTSVRVGKR